MYLIYALVIVAAALWILLALGWASSVARHSPELRDSGQQVRYGWHCRRCGKTHAPVCRMSRCGGPLVWVQGETTIKCARCHRRFIAHPMLFRLTPITRPAWCSGCNRITIVGEWKIR